MPTFDAIDFELLSSDAQSPERNEAIANLYGVFVGFRKRLIRQLGPIDGEEAYHAGFLKLLEALQQKRVADPSKLLGFSNSLFHNMYCQVLKKRVFQRERQATLSDDLPCQYSPLADLIRQEQVQIMRESLAELPDLWREVVTRFYINAESKEQICSALNLTETQYRLIKWRAKERLTRRSTGLASARLRIEPVRVGVGQNLDVSKFQVGLVRSGAA